MRHRLRFIAATFGLAGTFAACGEDAPPPLASASGWRAFMSAMRSVVSGWLRR